MPAEPLSECLIDWRLDLVSRGRSQSTIRDYLATGQALATWLGDPGVDEVGRRELRRYLAADDTLKPATIAKMYRNLQQLFKFLENEDLIEKNPMRGMQAPAVPEQPVPILTEEETDRLMATCSGTSFDDRRDLSIMRILLDSGMRCSELVGIKTNELDFDTLSVPVTGKGRRMRLAVFTHRTAEALRRYLRARRNSAVPDLWIGRRGAKLTDSGVRQMLERRGIDAKVPNVHPHRFRHTFAHRWRLKGGEEGDLMRLGGWRSRQMMDRYGASAADVRAHEAYRRLA